MPWIRCLRCFKNAGIAEEHTDNNKDVTYNRQDWMTSAITRTPDVIGLTSDPMAPSHVLTPFENMSEETPKGTYRILPQGEEALTPLFSKNACHII
jgi:hypothetical protein